MVENAQHTISHYCKACFKVSGYSCIIRPFRESVFRAKLIQEHQRWSLPPQWLETSVLIKHNDALKEISQCYKDVPLALSIICSVTLHIYSHQYDLLLCHNHLHNMPINVLAGTWDNYGHIKCVIQSHHFSCIV